MKKEMRNKLKILVVTILVVFLVVYGLFLLFKYPGKNGNLISQNGIVFTQPTLQVFSDTYSLNTFPDRVQMHYPYFLIIQPENLTTIVYNVQTKKKEKVINKVLLDYFKGNTVYNDNGYNTYVNGKNIGLFCDQAFYVSQEELLCLIRPNKSSLQNKVVTINPQTIATYDLYSPQNVITAIYYANSTLYIAEYDYGFKKSYIVVNGEKAEAPDLINTFYQMNGQIYTASFKSVRNSNNESYDLIMFRNEELSIKQVEKGKIIFDK